jgi:hypothetical protein
MKTRKLGLGLFTLLATTTAAWAAATPEEAARIQATFQTYIGTEPGVVTVTAAGEGYDIALDPMPYLKKITKDGFTAKFDAYHFNAVPQGNGLWAVTSSAPYSGSASAPGVLTFAMESPKVEWNGTYNDTLFTFMDSNYSISKLSISQSQTDPSSKIATSSASVIDSITGKGSATDVGNGLVDSESTLALSGLVSSTTMEMPPEMVQAGMANINYVANMAKANYVSSAKGLASKPLMEIASFFVSHPTKELVIKDQAVLKEKLLAALPLFASLKSDGTFENLSVDTGYGKFAMTGGGSTLGLSGAVKDGRVAEGFEITGLTMPEGLPLPPWSKGLIPTKMKLGFEFSGFDMEAPARKFITEMDVSKDEPVPPGSEAAYLAAFAPTNGVKLSIPGGEITADLFSLTYEGTSDISFAGLPKVDAKFRMTGMDKVIAQLQQAATDPTAQQGMAMLFAAKGIGKADGDAITWDVTMSPEGKLLVNGTDLSSMMGALSPPPQQ